MHNISWLYLRSKLPWFGILVIILIISVYPPGWDWINWFRPACLALLSGKSPYYLTGFFNPPWVLLPLIPIAILPERIGVAIITIASLSSFIFVSRKLGANPLTTLLIMTTPNFFFYGLSFANIDWMVVLGLIMPPQIGLFFVLAKPQIGLSVAIFWAYESFKRGKFREVLRVFTPVSAAFLISLLLFGLWPLREQAWAANSSLWPMSIPIGLALLATSLRNNKKGLAIVSAPFLSPYVGIQSWPVALLGLLPNQIETVVAVLGLWAVHLIENEKLRVLFFGMGL